MDGRRSSDGVQIRRADRLRVWRRRRDIGQHRLDECVDIFDPKGAILSAAAEEIRRANRRRMKELSKDHVAHLESGDRERDGLPAAGRWGRL